MNAYTASDVAPLGKLLPADLIGVYGDLVLPDVINTGWQKGRRGAIVEVVLNGETNDDSHRPDWSGVGTYLSQGLLSLGKSYGLYVHTTDLAFDTVRVWIATATAQDAKSLVDLTLATRPHVSGFGLQTEKVQCSLFQSCFFGSWIGKLWSDTSPGNFFDPGLVLAAYEGNVTHDLDRDAALTEAMFAGTLDQAVGWLIPYGDPPIFIVGLPVTSTLYQELMSASS